MSDRSSTMSALSIASMSSDSGASSDIGEERLVSQPRKWLLVTFFEPQ